MFVSAKPASAKFIPPLKSKVRGLTQEHNLMVRVEQARRASGANSWETGLALLDLAEYYDANRRSEESEPLWEQIRKILANRVISQLADDTFGKA